MSPVVARAPHKILFCITCVCHRVVHTFTRYQTKNVCRAFRRQLQTTTTSGKKDERKKKWIAYSMLAHLSAGSLYKVARDAQIHGVGKVKQRSCCIWAVSVCVCAIVVRGRRFES